jgi:hypothetical protein
LLLLWVEMYAEMLRNERKEVASEWHTIVRLRSRRKKKIADAR